MDWWKPNKAHVDDISTRAVNLEKFRQAGMTVSVKTELIATELFLRLADHERRMWRLRFMCSMLSKVRGKR